MPGLTETDRINSSAGCFATNDVMVTILPHCCFTIIGSTCRVILTTLINVRSWAFCHWSSVRCRISPVGGPPALLTRI